MTLGRVGLLALAMAACSSDKTDLREPSMETSGLQPSASPAPVPLAPVPGATPAGGWWDDSEASTRRTESVLAEMTIDDKIDMLHGELNNYFGFYNGALERVGVPALTMADGPSGVRIASPDVNGQRATQLPSPLALAATWSPDLARQYGDLAGREAHLTGHNVLLAPAIDVARVAQAGRAFEVYGEDPLLSGTLAAATIIGIQTNPVIGNIKHYRAYNQETNRLVGGNALIDERTLQEIYMRGFAIAVRDGHPGSAMCSFNKINGEYACQSDAMLNGILKTQMGFAGWVMTDYGANHSTAQAVLAGLDQEMPGNFSPEVGPGTCLFCGPLLDAVGNGEVPLSRIDDAVQRILRPMFALGLFDAPPVVQPLPEAEHGARARSIAERAMVLLENDGALPLDASITSIAVIGADADGVVAGGGSSLVKPTYGVSPLDAIRARAGAGVTVQFSPGSDPVTSVALLSGPEPVPSDFLSPSLGDGQGLRAEYFLNPDFSGTPALDRTEPYAGINGGFFIFSGLNAASPHFPPQTQILNTNGSVRWSGQLEVPLTGSYELALTSTGTGRLFVDDVLTLATAPGQQLTTVRATATFEAESVHTLRIEFVNDGPGGTDIGPQFKFGWTPPPGVVARQALAAADMARNADAAIIIVRDYSSEGGDRPDLDLPNGQAELIRQVAAANPRTIVVLTTGGAVQTSDWDGAVGAVLHAWYGGQEQGNAIARILFGDVNPSGRLPITMPTDEASTPVSTPEQFPGVGLDQQYSEGIFVGYRGYEQFALTPSYAFGHGLSYTSFEFSELSISDGSTAAGDDSPVEVTLSIRNSGSVAGIETVQVYAGALPISLPTAPKALAGWAQVDLAPGETRSVTVSLARESLSYWDVALARWRTPAGEVPLYVGASSADIRLVGSATLIER
jgi:beta-glucosidase